MGHMKKIIGLWLMVCGLWFMVGKVSAHEGSIDLSGSGVSCKGISLYQDGNYRVFGRCDGLVYPFETTLNKYVIWGKTSVRGEMIRIGEVEKGYFSGNIASAFDGVYITAEKDGLVRKPSERQVVAGKVDYFDFDKSKVATPPAQAGVPATAGTGVSVQESSEKATSTAGAVVGKILTSLLVIILVIVGLVIGASLIFRSRGSVSA